MSAARSAAFFPGFGARKALFFVSEVGGGVCGYFPPLPGLDAFPELAGAKPLGRMLCDPAGWAPVVEETQDFSKECCCGNFGLRARDAPAVMGQPSVHGVWARSIYGCGLVGVSLSSIAVCRM
jgi:hypothetical protein